MIFRADLLPTREDAVRSLLQLRAYVDNSGEMEGITSVVDDEGNRPPGKTEPILWPDGFFVPAGKRDYCIGGT